MSVVVDRDGAVAMATHAHRVSLAALVVRVAAFAAGRALKGRFNLVAQRLGYGASWTAGRVALLSAAPPTVAERRMLAGA